MVSEHGFENLYEELMSSKTIGLAEIKRIKAHYLAIYISTECELKIRKYPELLESVFWNVLSQTEIVFDKYNSLPEKHRHRFVNN